ncbi:MAG: hypothetical protein EBU49_05785, partial [Proteobacteria bacterium]|nr:hypothetical protein [Pseudomonadota bacterium]
MGAGRKNLISGRGAVAWMAIGAIVRLFLAAAVPLGNDEVYYWDWGRNPKLSYFDHPPGVSWLSAAAQQIFGESTGGLQARGLAPLFHFASSLLLFKIYIQLSVGRRTRASDLAFLALTQLIPAFGIGGFLLLPDAGLLLFSTAGLLLALELASRSHPPKLLHGLALGLVAGFAGLFKYHAAPIFGGILLAIASANNWRFLRAKSFWAVTTLTGMTVTLPVWVWNYQHEMSSFAFQASRGISGAHLDLLRAFRTLSGELIFLTPGFAALLILTIGRLWHHRSRTPERVVLWSCLPLLVLIHLTMTYKEVLPHWGLPAFWLLIPEAAILAGQNWSPRKLDLHLTIAGIITGCIITATAVPIFRNKLVTRTNGYPGALGELTFWPDFFRSSQANELRNKVETSLKINSSIRSIPPECPPDPILASFRWFTVAHMAWSIPGHPLVRSFEAG